MLLRFHLDPETEKPHIYRYGVNEEEVEEVMSRPGDDLPGRRESRIALGQTAAGRVQDLVDYYDHQTDEDAAAEHEAALSRPDHTLIEIPTELVPAVREIIAGHEKAREPR